MTQLLLNLSITELENLLNFTASYGVLALCLGLALLTYTLIKDFKTPTLLFFYFCFIELMIYFFFPSDDMKMNLFYLYGKIFFAIYMGVKIFRTESVLMKKLSRKLLLALSMVLISIISLDNIMVKSVGKIDSERYQNQYGLDYQKRLIDNTAFYQIRLEIYNKKNNYVKVMHKTDAKSIRDVIHLIEDKKESFWNGSEKFLTIKDLE